MNMPSVAECNVDECAYNSMGMCHALAITIGDGVHPQCDTFCKSSMRGGDQSQMAGVGACKVDCCVHNNALECQANGIVVGRMGDEVDCLTFTPA